MKRAALAFLAALSLAACASSTDRPALAVPSGEFRAMNPGMWSWDGNKITSAPPGAAAATGISPAMARSIAP